MDKKRSDYLSDTIDKVNENVLRSIKNSVGVCESQYKDEALKGARIALDWAKKDILKELEHFIYRSDSNERRSEEYANDLYTLTSIIQKYTHQPME